MKIGVLALQGAFIEHIRHLQKIGVDSIEIRQLSDFKGLDGIILPGGESTVMGKLLHDLQLFHPIRQAILDGMPVFGTCAGLILLANKLENDYRQHLATMHITVRRNAYGRQLGSFTTTAELKGIGNIPMVFIRAPFIASVDEKVEVLATVDNHIVAAKQGNQLVTSFHPELTADTSTHRYFISMCK